MGRAIYPSTRARRMSCWRRDRSMIGAAAPPLYAREEGAGHAILFLHALGASGRYWHGRLGPLATECRCLMPDLLGFGRSPKPDVAYTIEDHLAAVQAMLGARDAGDA